MASGPCLSDDEYNFSNSQRGIAIIICNGKFSSRDLRDRPAAEKDREQLVSMFQALGFADEDSHNYSNLKAAEIRKVLNKGELVIE